MSTDRPKRNIVKKKLDISDGMPWCEERLVRKVLFLSLREFRDMHRTSHKNSRLRTRAHTCKLRNTLSHVWHKTRRNIPKNTVIKQRRSKVQKTKPSQDSHAQKNKYSLKLQNKQTQSKMCQKKMQHTFVQENPHMFQKSSLSTRTLRSHKTLSPLNTAEPAKHPNRSQHKDSAGNTRPARPNPARILRSHTISSHRGPVRKGISPSPLSASPSRNLSLQSHPQQRRPASIHPDRNDLATKRPRLQAQRKFAQSPPSSPVTPVLMTSAPSSNSHNLAVVTCLTRHRPKTEDFLSFLCLRGSGALPSSMAFLARGQAKEQRVSQHLTSCLSTYHRPARAGKNMRTGSRTTVRQQARSLRGNEGSAGVNSFCPVTARAQRRRERERREEEQQQRRREGKEKDRRKEAERHLLRPCQLSLQVAMVTGVPPLKPDTGVCNRRPPRPCTTPSSTCNQRGQSRSQETANRNRLRHSNQELPCNQHLPLEHRTPSNLCSKPKTFCNLRNSQQNSCRTPAQIITNGLVKEQSENPGALRLSRRRRGLPPEASPSHLKQVTYHNISKKCGTLQTNDGDVPLKTDCHISQREADCDKDDREQCVSHVDKIMSSHDEDFGEDRCGHVREKGSFMDQANVEKVGLQRFTALEFTQDRMNLTKGVTHYDLSPASEVMCKSVRDKRPQRNLSASSTKSRRVTRTNSRSFSRASEIKPTISKAVINSPTHICIDPTPISSVKHTKSTSKGSNKVITKFTSSGSSYSIDSKGATNDSLKATMGHLTVQTASFSSRSRTSKGSSKRPTQTKSTTSAMKSRTSPRIHLTR